MENKLQKYFESYADMVMKAANTFQKKQNLTPRKIDYSTEVANIIRATKENIYIDGIKSITEETVRSQVSRTLDALSKGTNGKLLCINGKYYILNNDANYNKKLEEEYYLCLKGKIKIIKPDVLRISKHACAVSVELTMSAKKEGLNISQIFSDCIGEDCFGIIEGYNTTLIIFKSYYPQNDNTPTQTNSENKEENDKVMKKITREKLITNALEAAISRIHKETFKKKKKNKNINSDNEEETSQ